MTFSQRIGRKPAKKDIQIQSMDDDLRNGLWNVVDTFYFEAQLDYSTENWEFFELFKNLWDELLKKKRNEIRPSRLVDDFRHIQVQPIFFDLQWNEIYDYIEYLEQNTDDEDIKSEFKLKCNKVLEREFSAYRFVGEDIVQITSKEEISEIEKAMTSPLQTVNIHLETALHRISDRNNPDYRNSIKESISAVEALCVKIVKQNKTTLGKALDIIKNNSKNTILMNEALSSAFDKLYGFTSSDNGIRHKLLEESKLEFVDARFMLIACSAFVNYLVSKADDANINLE